FLPRLKAYAACLMGTQTDVEDLLQEVWLRAFTKRRSFAGQGPVGGWLLVICRNVCFRHLRRQGLRARLTREWVVTTSASAGEITELDLDELQPTDHARVLDAVARLPLRQRSTLMLRLIEGRTTKEPATILNCSEGTVKAALHAAIMHLREDVSARE